MKAQFVWWLFVIVEVNHALHQNCQAEETVKWLRILMCGIRYQCSREFSKMGIDFLSTNSHNSIASMSRVRSEVVRATPKPN